MDALLHLTYLHCPGCAVPWQIGKICEEQRVRPLALWFTFLIGNVRWVFFPFRDIEEDVLKQVEETVCQLTQGTCRFCQIPSAKFLLKMPHALAEITLLKSLRDRYLICCHDMVLLAEEPVVWDLPVQIPAIEEQLVLTMIVPEAQLESLLEKIGAGSLLEIAPIEWVRLSAEI